MVDAFDVSSISAIIVIHLFRAFVSSKKIGVSFPSISVIRENSSSILNCLIISLKVIQGNWIEPFIFFLRTFEPFVVLCKNGAWFTPYAIALLINLY